MSKKNIIYLMVSILFLTGCTLTETVLNSNNYLKIVNEPKELYDGLMKNKLNTEEIGRLVEEFYKPQIKGDPYIELKNQYQDIRVNHNNIISDLGRKIKEGQDFKYEGYKERISNLEKKIAVFANKYKSKASGFSSPSLDTDPILIYAIIKEIGKNIYIKGYVKAFKNKFEIVVFEKNKYE
ncbi:MAG: hypothetical protein COA50_07605 [Flavobacteriaceae bacterium]|nr:MAG: hypothetical protein COA50_07605 [Flavobacteriaceae bacterium]